MLCNWCALSQVCLLAARCRIAGFARLSPPSHPDTSPGAPRETCRDEAVNRVSKQVSSGGVTKWEGNSLLGNFGSLLELLGDVAPSRSCNPGI
jgi:hypothetical protein